MAEVSRLPLPLTQIWDWQLRAACRNLDSAIFFHPENERGAAKVNRDQNAKLICSTCPVIQACRRHALAVQEPYGVWGGMTIDERQAILRRPTSTSTNSESPRFQAVDEPAR